mmetsp:Transcript_8563/g.24768  ORF Transcript_8563/g.24768 Transcript_8563/m.24768 type:complete len:210 (+) Transcript_8563:56-685(+)
MAHAGFERLRIMVATTTYAGSGACAAQRAAHVRWEGVGAQESSGKLLSHEVLIAKGAMPIVATTQRTRGTHGAATATVVSSVNHCRPGAPARSRPWRGRCGAAAGPGSAPRRRARSASRSGWRPTRRARRGTRGARSCAGGARAACRRRCARGPTRASGAGSSCGSRRAARCGPRPARPAPRSSSAWRRPAGCGTPPAVCCSAAAAAPS